MSNIGELLNELMSDVMDALPVIIAAIIVVIIGYFVGKFVGRAVNKLIEKVGIEKQIPVLMVSPRGMPEDRGNMVEMLRAMAERVWNAGLPVIDYVHTDSYDWKTTEKIPLYSEAVRNLKPGITEMIVHCTKPDPVIDVITNKRELLYGDYYALISPEVKKVIEEEGIILTTWRELKERRDRVKLNAAED